MAKSDGKQRSRTSNITEISDFAGVSRNTIYAWEKLPGYPRAKDGMVCLWDLAVWRETRSAPSDDVDPAAGSGSSPWLEEYRKQRALMAQLDREEREGELLSKDRVHGFVLRVANLLRGWLEKLQIRHGEEFYQVGMDVLKDIETETEREFGSDEDTAETTPNAQ